MYCFHLHGPGLDLGDFHRSLGRGAGARAHLHPWRAPGRGAVGGGGVAEAVAVAAVLVAVRGRGEIRQDARLPLLHALLAMGQNQVKAMACHV